MIANFAHFIDALVAITTGRANRYYAILAFATIRVLAERSTVLTKTAALAMINILIARFAIGTVMLCIAVSAAFGTAVVAARTDPAVAAALAAIFAFDILIPRTNVIMRLGYKSTKHDKAKHDADYLGEMFFHLSFPPSYNILL